MIGESDTSVCAADMKPWMSPLFLVDEKCFVGFGRCFGLKAAAGPRAQLKFARMTIVKVVDNFIFAEGK